MNTKKNPGEKQHHGGSFFFFPAPKWTPPERVGIRNSAFWALLFRYSCQLLLKSLGVTVDAGRCSQGWTLKDCGGAKIWEGPDHM